MSVPRCTLRTLSGGPAYIPWTGGAKRRKSLAARMMTQRPSPAGDEGNLVGGVTRPRPKGKLPRRRSRSQRSGLNWTAGPPNWEGSDPERQPGCRVCCGQLLPFERRRLAVLVTTPVPVVVVGATVRVLVHAASASVRTTGTRARNLTGAMLPRSRDGMVPRKDIQRVASRQPSSGELKITVRPARTVTLGQAHSPERMTSPRPSTMYVPGRRRTTCS